MHIANASPIELVWTIANLVTLGITGYLFREAVIDYNVVIRSGENGLVKRVALGGVRRFSMKLAMALAFVLAGLVATFLVPVNPSAAPTAGIMALLFMVADTALVSLSIESAAERYFAMEYLRRQDTRAETQNQREDREFGEQRRALERDHIEEGESG